MHDVAPDLIDKVNKFYRKELMKDRSIKVVDDRIKSDKADYSDAYKYSKAIGNARAKAFKNVISSSVLPDGRMYFNIADRLMKETIAEDYALISSKSAEVQSILNSKSKIGLKAQTSKLDNDRLDGFINRLASESQYDDVAWILDSPVREFCMSAVDSTVKANADFQSDAGVEVTIERIEGNCCNWCKSLEGIYTYPNVPADVFARHDNCSCQFIYNNKRLKAYTASNGKANSFRDY